MDSVSGSLSRKVASEFGPNCVAVSMRPSYLTPDYSGFIGFTTRIHCVVPWFVHIRVSPV